ncbi:MAG: hypothetical protein HC893_15395 [Chloroflexaceae bacterium]|nr:hypothetical protein [Chloroflexaceae bacterium]
MAVDVGDDMAVSAGLRERGFTVTPLAGWGVPGCIRITFGLSAQNERFIAALTAVLAQGDIAHQVSSLVLTTDEHR